MPVRNLENPPCRIEGTANPAYHRWYRRAHPEQFPRKTQRATRTGTTVVRTCQNCGVEFAVLASSLRRPRRGLYCSAACRLIGRPYQQKQWVAIPCQECGQTFSTPPCHLGRRRCCSRSCAAVARGRKMRGSLHPAWKGGTSKRRSAASQRAIKRRVKEAGCCERCGSKNNLHGHHVKYYSTHPDLRDDESNIQVLCNRCHAQEHPRLSAFISRGVVASTKAVLFCQVCGKEFLTTPSYIGTKRYCSKKCHNSSLRAERKICFSAIPAVRKDHWNLGENRESR